MGSEFDYARITPDEAALLADKGRLAWDWSPGRNHGFNTDMDLCGIVWIYTPKNTPLRMIGVAQTLSDT
ncbi:hypothetical protein AWB69_03885 [Caballeronia udeis]|uniref:Uncharacterized protein n=1 Tax=Caballeronia udeis TaxID=1232866 RepID=A0A158H4Q7_9BURK|nr:hypothetical protein AWB69_03885 [Caballeronia udeis]